MVDIEGIERHEGVVDGGYIGHCCVEAFGWRLSTEAGRFNFCASAMAILPPLP